MKEIIKEIVRQEGPITFARFMELALYYPQLGYYNQEKTIIGKEGDFYTSVHVHRIFGEMLAEQIGEMAQQVPSQEFKIVEFGAGSGYLALDILSALEDKFPAIYQRTCYYIIEAGSGLRQQQRELLKEQILGGKVRWVESISAVGRPFFGCVLSNELVDAFPVHLVQMEGGCLKEVFVGLKGEDFQELLDNLSTPYLKEYFQRQNVKLAEGQRAEVNLAALEWIKEIGRALDLGFVITIDYGYEKNLMYHRVRRDGTLMCYHRHRAHDNLFVNVGSQDITAHVNFTALSLWGEEAGLITAGLTNQMHFLFNLGIIGKMPGDAKTVRAVQHLVSPEGMGGIFKILIQYKNIASPVLKGLRETGF